MKEYFRQRELDEVANAIVKLMPSHDQFFSSELPLVEYSGLINQYHASEKHLERQKVFKELIRQKIQRLFIPSELKRIDVRLSNKEGLIAGVIDHHGILDHPILFGGILVSNFYKLNSKETNGDILTFATGNIPHNEPFSRGGILFHGKRIKLYPKKDKNKIVYGTLPEEFNIVKRLQKSHAWHTYSSGEQTFLMGINTIIQGIDFSTCQSLGDQITKINFYLWPLLFAEELRQPLPNLISLEYDDLVAQYLIHVIENDKISFVFRMLFDSDFRSRTIKHFEGVVGAWNDEHDKGTHFFWGIDERGERISFRVRDNTLVADNGATIPLEPNLVIQGLRDKKILCGMLLKFSLLIFYMGLKPHAGFSSVEYLTRMKKSIMDFLANEYAQEVTLINGIQTNSMISNPIVYSKMNNEIKSLPAFDIMFNGGVSKDYFEKVSKVPFKNFMTPFLAYYDFAVSRYGTQENKKTFDLPAKLLHAPLKSLFG